MIIKIDGKEYNIQLERSIELGVLTEVKLPLVLKAGDVYVYPHSGEKVYLIKSHSNSWSLGGLNGNPFLLFSSMSGVSENEMRDYLTKHYRKVN